MVRVPYVQSGLCKTAGIRTLCSGPTAGKWRSCHIQGLADVRPWEEAPDGNILADWPGFDVTERKQGKLYQLNLTENKFVAVYVLLQTSDEGSAVGSVL